MLGWTIRLLLLLFIIRAILRLARGIMAGLNPPGERHPTAVPLARDPVCGTFVVPSQALTAGSGADLRYFCSEKCRRKYEINPAG
jgi:YHS domain-containing protein